MEQVLIKNGILVLSNRMEENDLLIVDGKIKKIGKNLSYDADKTNLTEASGKIILPGGIDAHVHFQLPTPAGPSCDDFLTGSRAALAGGTTFCFDFVTPLRGQLLKDALTNRQREAQKSLTECRLHMGITWFDHTIPRQMHWCVKEAGIHSFKVYLAYKGSIGIEYSELEEVMKTAASLGAVVMVHCEEGDTILKTQKALLAQGKTAPRFHAVSRPNETESDSVKKVIDLCRETGCQTYIVHTSTAQSINYIRQAKSEGLPVFCETCPQYLLLDESVYEKPSAEVLKYVISPPIRSIQDQTALWTALQDGTVDVISTDHCPFNTFGQKDTGLHDFTKIPNGAGGVEFRLALLYTYGVMKQRINLQQFISLTSTNAAKIFGLFPHKGQISEGAEADLIIWNPEKKTTVSVNSQLQNCDSNIYEGMELQGHADMVFIKERFEIL